ncbi:MAG: aminotransferase class V-fold PLP-dependent enzyme [Actinobacteria bacterium]|nr:aminotransferase class V-fold PLP-dependent enzyme [Actinomycetota bacterium]
MNELVHLECASAARLSTATLAATVAHMEREAAVGPGIAYAEADGVLARLRADLAALFGMRPDQVALAERATRALADVFAAWPLRPRARVGVVRAEYGSTRMLLEAAAARGEVEVVELPVDGEQRIVPESVAGVDLVILSHVMSQRGVVQPVREVAAVGPPVVVDVAQSAGHIDVGGLGAAALVGTSRKWLRGPRGVGYVAVSDEWAERLTPRAPDLDTAAWDDDRPRFAPGAARFHQWEGTIAGRVGLAHALRELHETGPAVVARHAAALGVAARRRLVDAGWWVGEPVDEPTGMVTFGHVHHQSAEVHARLREGGVAVTLVPVGRALDVEAPVLRAAFHTYTTDADLDRLLTALPRT